MKTHLLCREVGYGRTNRAGWRVFQCALVSPGRKVTTWRVAVNADTRYFEFTEAMREHTGCQVVLVQELMFDLPPDVSVIGMDRVVRNKYFPWKNT